MCFFGTQLGLSQRIDVKTQDYNETNGLSTYANFIHKDSRDIIWIGTQFGLYRFDGQEFAHFDEKDGLPFRQIMEIFEDTEGWFWLHKTCIGKPNCQRDLAFFHPLTKEVLTFEERFGEKVSIQASQVQGIAQDSAKIYFTGDKKLLIWSKEGGIREKAIAGTKNSPTLWAKVNDEILGAVDFDVINRNEYFLQNHQYLVIDTGGQIRRYFQLPSEIQAIGFDRFRTNHFDFEKLRVKNLEIRKASDGSLVFDTLNYSLNCCPKNYGYADLDGKLFINEHGHLFHSDLGLVKEVERIYPKGLDLAPQNFVIQINRIWIKEKGRPNYFQYFRGGPRHDYFDFDTKTAWFAYPKGIKRIEYNTQRIKHLKASDQDNQLARSVYVISDNELLLCIFTKWFFYNTQTNELRPYPSISNQAYNHPHSNIGFTTSDQSTLWFFNHSTQIRNKRLFKFDTQNASLTTFPPLAQNPEFRPRQMIQIENRFLIGDNKGLTWYDIDNHRLEAYQQYNGFEVLQQAKVHFFKQYDEEYFWIGSNMGLYWCSTEKGVLAKFGDTEAGDFYLPAQDFYHMTEAKGGGYWLATMQGLIHFSVDGGRLTVDGVNNELTSPSVKRSDRPPSTVHRHYQNLSTNELLAAFEDDYGFVWMPTPHGLIQMQISTGLSKTYREGDGLSSKSFQEYAHVQMPDGTLVLGSYKGFNVLHPKDFKDVGFNPEVSLAILDFEQYKANTDSIEYLLKEVTEKREIILEPGDKFFNIRVALTDYREAEKHRFAYKIEGYQEEWQEDKSNLIRISGLPYGEYVLKIKGRLSDGQFSKSVLEIPIQVLRPFYFKTGFFVFAILTFAAGIFWFFRWRTQNLKKRQKELETEVSKATQTIKHQNEELKNLDKLKSRFFANVSHELRTPLTLMLGPINSLKKRTLSQEKSNKLIDFIHNNSTHLLKLVNEILDLSKLETDRLEVKETAVNFHAFLQPLVAQFSSFGDSESVRLNFEYHAEQSLNILLDTDKFEKIANNYLSNALKFTPIEGQVDFIIEDLGERLLLKVKDTGSGIHPDDLPYIFDRFYQSKQTEAPAQGGTGIGLSLCKELAELLEGKVWAESELGIGSTFYFEFPKKETVDGERRTVDGERLTVDGAEQVSLQIAENEQTSTKSKINELPPAKPSTVHRPPSTILIVEDNLQLREYMTVLLEDKYQVITAENGNVAWEILTVDGGRLTVDGENTAPDRLPSTVNRP